jgi:hypothetical protein
VFGVESVSVSGGSPADDADWNLFFDYNNITD